MNPEETPLKQIRTFQGDVAEALHKQQESLVTIQRSEQLKRESVGQFANNTSLVSDKRKELFFLILGSLLLFAIGGLGAWYAYGEFVKKSSTPVIVVPTNRFVSTNSQIELKPTTSSRETLIDAISSATRGVPAGELRHLILNLSTSEFLERLASRAPSNLVRAFDPLFMLGVYGKSLAMGGPSTFLIIKLESFENAFAGMLAWESDLRTDIGSIFATAERLRNVPPGVTFTDITDKNKDIRTLSPDGEPLLLYSFFDNNLLIITDNLETMRVLIDHMTREKLSR